MKTLCFTTTIGVLMLICAYGQAQNVHYHGSNLGNSRAVVSQNWDRTLKNSIV